MQGQKSLLYYSDDRHGGVDANAECTDAPDHHAQYDAEGSSANVHVPRRKQQSNHTSSLTFSAGNHLEMLYSA